MPDCLTLWKRVRNLLYICNITDVQQNVESIVLADPVTSVVLDELVDLDRQFSVDKDDPESTVLFEPIRPAALPLLQSFPPSQISSAATRHS